jgi:hypothetical protein
MPKKLSGSSLRISQENKIPNFWDFIKPQIPKMRFPEGDPCREMLTWRKLEAIAHFPVPF